MQRERRGSDLRDELLSMSIGSMRRAWWCSEQGRFHAFKKKKKRESRFRTLLLSKAHAKRWGKAHARFSRKAAFGWFWRLLAAFWETWKAIKEEEIVRRNHNNPTHAYRGCEKEKRRHASRGCASEKRRHACRGATKVTIAHANRGSAKKKIRSRYFESESESESESVIEIWSFDHLICTSSCEWEWEWEWDSSGVDGWNELLHGVFLLQKSL